MPSLVDPSLYDISFLPGVWIGLNDIVNEGQYRWETDSCHQPAWKNWKGGQPNNSNNCDGEKQNCVYMQPNGQWDDKCCNGRQNNRFAALCEQWP